MIGVPGDYIVTASGCWEWQRSRTAGGYGRVSRDKHGVRAETTAHRWYYELVNGPVPHELHVDHLCGNRACVNPDHLEAVAPVENVRRSSATSLTAASAAEIRRRYAEGEGPKALGVAFGVHPTTISNVVSGRRWGPEGKAAASG